MPCHSWLFMNFVRAFITEDTEITEEGGTANGFVRVSMRSSVSSVTSVVKAFPPLRQGAAGTI
jgi:hypothetical protein